MKYCLNNGACWPNYPSLLTKQGIGGKRKYLNITTKIFEVQKIASLVCYLIADAATAGLLPGLPEGAHYVVQVRLGVIHCAASHSLQKRKISLAMIKSGVMNVDDEHACDTEHQDIKASNIRQIENTTTNIFCVQNIFSGEHQRSIGAWRSVLRLCSGEFLVVKCHLWLSTLVSEKLYVHYK